MNNLNKSLFFSTFSLVVSQPAASSSTPVAASSGEEGKGETPKPKKNRCFLCRKRVGLTGEFGKAKSAQWLCFFFSLHVAMSQNGSLSPV